MLNLKEEIEKFLSLDWVNTNNKEQNFQGRLYAYLQHLEQWGYLVEMETSRNDEHIKYSFSSYTDWAKTEMDILVYKKDMSEKYAAELKWFYDPTFHYFDHIEEYKMDVKFARQLVEQGGFTEACSIVIINPKDLTNPSKSRKNFDELMAFGYNGDNSNAEIKINENTVPLVWKDLHNKVSTGDKCYYYIVSFNKQS